MRLRRKLNLQQKSKFEKQLELILFNIAAWGRNPDL